MRPGVAGAVLATAAGLACAQPSSPPGGQPDRAPPRVVAVSPAPFDTLEDLRAPVRIEFDERLSMRLEGVSELEEAVLVSPATGEVRVERGRRSLEISIAGGWQRGLVYRVVVLPVFRDLFGNQRVEPIELVFTTGAPIPPTAVAGFIEDRITGLPVPSARVEAVRRLDTVTYVAVSDTGGFFALRNVPAGVYDVRAWEDRDRDRDVDFSEKQDLAPVPLGFQDTVLLSLRLLPLDTSAARLMRAEPVDSVRVRLLFDDHFDVGPVDGRALVRSLPDSALVAEGTLIHSTALDSILARERAAADSARARADSLRAAAADTLPPGDTAAIDTLAAPPAERPARQRPTPRLPAAGGARPAAGARSPAGPLPSNALVLVLPRPLEPGATYLVEVSGVRNIRGVGGGGGTATFRVPVPADTTAGAPGTGAPGSPPPPPRP